MCGSCARMVVAPRPRVPVPVQSGRPAVAVPVRPDQRPVPQAASPMAQPLAATAPAPVAPDAHAGGPSLSPWVRNRTDAGDGDGTISIEIGAGHDGGLLQRGVHTEIEHD